MLLLVCNGLWSCQEESRKWRTTLPLLGIFHCSLATACCFDMFWWFYYQWANEASFTWISFAFSGQDETHMLWAGGQSSFSIFVAVLSQAWLLVMLSGKLFRPNAALFFEHHAGKFWSLQYMEHPKVCPKPSRWPQCITFSKGGRLPQNAALHIAQPIVGPYFVACERKVQANMFPAKEIELVVLSLALKPWFVAWLWISQWQRLILVSWCKRCQFTFLKEVFKVCWELSLHHNLLWELEWKDEYTIQWW